MTDDTPLENIIVIPPDEVSAQWGKFPPGMTTPPWQAEWFYVAKSKEEAKHIESLGFVAVGREELGPEQIPILRNADVVLLNNDDGELVTTLAPIVRQLRSVNVPGLADCNAEEFARFTAPPWADPTPTTKKKPAKTEKKFKSDDLPYVGPVVEVPDQGPDPLDEHGAPVGEEVSPKPGHDEKAQAPATDTPWSDSFAPEDAPPTSQADETESEQEGVPFVMTHAMKAALHARGKSKNEIDHMT